MTHGTVGAKPNALGKFMLQHRTCAANLGVLEIKGARDMYIRRGSGGGMVRGTMD